MDIVESISDISVQDPEEEVFSSANLRWIKSGNVEHIDDVALIPYARVDSFIIGECSNVECPTRFHIERAKKRLKILNEYKDDEYLEYKLYWCSFGPENYGEGGGTLPSRRYRLNTRNRVARPQSMRGCTCHFVVKRLYARPSVALIIYNDRRHINKSGSVCHGPLDGDAIGPGANKIPYVANDVKQQTMSMIYLGIPDENVLEKHIEGIQRYSGSNAAVNGAVASQYVQKLGMIIKRSTHELDLDDHCSIRIWIERNKKLVFFFQDSSESDPFILGIQTEWQLEQLLRFGHKNVVAADSTFGIKRLKYPLWTLLVFDSRQHALPVAWVITRSFTKLDVAKWMRAILDRVLRVEPEWKINGFLIDDAAAEMDPIRDVFGCPVLFSFWRLRRSWLRNVVRKCRSLEVQRDIFKRLGKLVDSVWREVDVFTALEELAQDFSDEIPFFQYFNSTWLPKIEMWLSAMRTLPVASQEAAGAIETYHVKLKAKLFDDSHLNAFQRVDWLVHKLTTELHSCYWLDRHADETDSFENIKEDYVSSTSWHRALQIPNSAVSMDEQDHLCAHVLSQKNSNRTHTVWNFGSEFAFCSCSWSLQGNLCKHIIKINMMIEDQQVHQSSLSFSSSSSSFMSFQSFKRILDDILKKPMDDSISLDLSMAWSLQILDQIKQLVEISSCGSIKTMIKSMPLQWISKKHRSSIGLPSTNLPISSSPSMISKQLASARRTQKRKRLSVFLQ